MKGRKIKSLKMFFVMLILLLPCMCFAACLNGGDKAPADNTEYEIEFELYDVNGGVRIDIKREYVVSGKKATAPSDDSFSHKEGFGTDGWYTDKAFTKKFDFEDAISADITLYARQKWLELTVTFVNDKGIAPDSVKVIHGEMLTTLPIFDDIGFETFGGWYTEKAFENEFTLESRVKQNLTLYAKWQYKKFEITFAYDEYKQYNKVAYKDAIKTYTDRIETSASSSGIADGWFLDAEFTKPVNLQQYEVNADATLYLRLRVDYFNRLQLIKLDDGTYKATRLWLTPKAGEAYYIPGEFAGRDGTKCIISTIGTNFISFPYSKALIFGKEITTIEKNAFNLASYRENAINIHFMANVSDITFAEDYIVSSGRDFMHMGCKCKTDGDYLYQQDDENSVSITSYLGDAPQVLNVPASLAGKTVKRISQGALNTYGVVALPSTIEVASGYISSATNIICAFSEAKASTSGFNANWNSCFSSAGSSAVTYDATVLKDNNHFYSNINEQAYIWGIIDKSKLSEIYTTPSTLGGLPVIGISKLKIAGVSKVVIADSISIIGDNAIDLDYVKAIHFGSGITKILGNYFTSFDSSFETVTYSAEITDFNLLYEFRFMSGGNGSKWYKNLPDGDVYIDNILIGFKGEMPLNYHLDIKQGTKYVASDIFLSSTISKLTIPDSVITINDGAFLQCDFVEVYIPDSVVEIGKNVFSFIREGTLTISCGATAKPIGWHDNWSLNSPEILWGQARPTE